MNYSVSVEGGRVELLESDQPDAYILVVSTDGTFDVYLDPYHLRKVANMFYARGRRDRGGAVTTIAQIILAVYAVIAVGAWLVAVVLQAWREGQR